MRYLKLKVDLHLHNSEDMAEKLKKSKGMLPPKKFIDMAIQRGYNAIAFTHHGLLYDDPKVIEYAKKRGLILIPGIEAFINHKHVLLLNYIKKKHILNFETLRREKSPDMLVIAPHPYYKTRVCLEDELEKNIDCFDAIEYCHFYTRLINPNRKAVRLAKRYNLPMIGNSDAHFARQFGTTYSYVYARQKSITAVIEAIKEGRIEYVSKPLSFSKLISISAPMIWKLPYFVVLLLRKIALQYNLNPSQIKYRIKRWRLKSALTFHFSKKVRPLPNQSILRHQDIATT